MFKNEYQGGPYLDVFSAQGREPISKKCRLIGNSTTIKKHYEKEVKSYVYALEGEPTSTKIHLPKDDKQTLGLLQKFLVLQLFVPRTQPFSFELTVSDLGQNKRRIFLSLNQKDITVTPLHAKFPLTVLCAGAWLNLCIDLDSLVENTFSSQKFRALENITVTANCKLRRIFTLKTPPVDNSGCDDDIVTYPRTEVLPKACHLSTTSDQRPITQILNYPRLAKKKQSDIQTNNEATVTDDSLTHIAFGSKVVIPSHVRKTSGKETQDNNTVKTARTSRLSSSKAKLTTSSPDLSITPREKDKGTKQERSVSLNEQNGNVVTPVAMQPRPPKTGSAGKVRRAIRVKPSTSGSNSKTRQEETQQVSQKTGVAVASSKVSENEEIDSVLDILKTSSQYNRKKSQGESHNYIYDILNGNIGKENGVASIERDQTNATKCKEFEDMPTNIGKFDNREQDSSEFSQKEQDFSTEYTQKERHFSTEKTQKERNVSTEYTQKERDVSTQYEQKERDFSIEFTKEERDVSPEKTQKEHNVLTDHSQKEQDVSTEYTQKVPRSSDVARKTIDENGNFVDTSEAMNTTASMNHDFVKSSTVIQKQIYDVDGHSILLKNDNSYEDIGLDRYHNDENNNVERNDITEGVVAVNSSLNKKGNRISQTIDKDCDNIKSGKETTSQIIDPSDGKSASKKSFSALSINGPLGNGRTQESVERENRKSFDDSLGLDNTEIRNDENSSQLLNASDRTVAKESQDGINFKKDGPRNPELLSGENSSQVSDRTVAKESQDAVNFKKDRPRNLELFSDQAMFTFSSAPRSPRSAKRRLLSSPCAQEETPEVVVSLVGNDVQRNRGASLEDDFCRSSDDEEVDDEDDIQKLLKSSLSPRNSPQPEHHQLRQSIRSSMLKEIPAPVLASSYDAHSYQDDGNCLNQSNASSWRFDQSDSSNSLNNTGDLEDSLNVSRGQLITLVTNGCDSDEYHSDDSGDTSLDTWREPPQELRGNKYQHEMKPPGTEPDLTATISISPRDYNGVLSPLTNHHTPIRTQKSSNTLLSPGGLRQQSDEEELDLLYDPILNCYFDPKTHKYYELA